MRYLGSKGRHAKKLIGVMNLVRKPGQTFVEPFAGGFNLTTHAENPRIAADINPYIVALFRAAQEGWIPPEHVTPEQYAAIKNNKDSYPPELVGFVGFGCSFGARFFGGYARDKKGEDCSPVPGRTSARVVAQASGLIGVNILCCDYREIPTPPSSLIYCDPPYANTTGYSKTPTFDHGAFWSWCRDKKAEGHTVFVSEYTAPDDMACVFEINTHTNFSSERKKALARTEKLFLV